MKRFVTDGNGILREMPVEVRSVRREPEMGLVKVYPDVRYQQLIGIGAALTEASGAVFAQMPDSQKIRFAELCFGEQGNRYSFARLSIQSCVKATLRLPMKGTVKTASIRYIAMTVIHCAAAFPVTPERAGYRALHPASVITSMMLPYIPIFLK